jgi:carboxyl-terminal processing protease
MVDASRRQVRTPPACRRALTISVLPFLLLAACVSPPHEARQPGQLDGRIFAEAYQDITDYHLLVTSPEALTQVGLGKLTSLDKSITVMRDGEDVVLRRGSQADHFAAPPTGDATGWGKLTAKILDDASARSPQVAAVAPDRLTEMVIDGALGSLDPFSHYARPTLAKERRDRRYGFGGIGIIFDDKNDRAVISGIVPETPAAAGGLRAGDRIVSLDGIPIDRLAPTEIDDHLRGEVGTNLALVVTRPSEARQISLTLTRAIIVEPTVSLDLRGDIARLRITAFNQRTSHNVAALLQQAHQQAPHGLRGIVLDLRGDPGGLLEQSVEVARLFLDGGAVVRTIGRRPDARQVFDAPANAEAERLPVAVLINGGTASAAEIVASTLQDSGRAIVIGTASFGKGTVQNVLDLPNNAELTVTWAQLIPPRGYQLHHHGVVPTICTADARNGAENATSLLHRTPSPVAAGLAMPREDLDEAGWQSLRSLCPADRALPTVDIEVAQTLLDDPTLYRRVLATMPGVAAAARRAEARAPSD